MSDSYDTTKLSDKHLTAIERGKIEALQKEEKSQAEITQIQRIKRNAFGFHNCDNFRKASFIALNIKLKLGKHFI